MNDRKSFNVYLNDLENRLGDAKVTDLYRHLPSVIEIMLAGPVTLAGPAPSDPTPTKQVFRCPHCNAMLYVE